MICGSGGWKSRLAKAAGAEAAGQMGDEKVHAVVARSTFPSQNVQNTPMSDHFWKLRCRKSARRCGAKHISKSKCTKHTRFGPLLEVAMSKKCTPLWREAHFQVKSVKNTTWSDHFCTLRCRKSARRCGAKHISKWKCTKHTRSGPLLEVAMSKKCTPLWREAHFEVKSVKNLRSRTTFWSSDVKKLHAVVARSTFRSQKCKKLRVSDHFEVASLQYTTLHDIALHYTTLHYTPQHYNYNYTTTLHYTPLHSTTLNYTTLHYITHYYTPLHYITLHYTNLPLHFTTLHYTDYTSLHSSTLQLQLHNYTTTQLHSTTVHYTKLHYTTLHYTTLHYLPLHLTTLHYTTLTYTTTTTTTTQLHSTTLNYTALHYTTLHYTTFHYTPLHYNTLHYITLHYTEWHCTTDRQIDR